uniref:Uncharacterized protein n=1 Tax=viral metagenome TaxID=1070528 RepID=A0A6M3LVB9_9ZZZZ
MITKWAVQWLTWRLRKDDGFWISYQANIAGAFQDEYHRAMEKMKSGIEPFDIHTVSNNAAINFMKLWTK